MPSLPEIDNSFQFYSNMCKYNKILHSRLSHYLTWQTMERHGKTWQVTAQHKWRSVTICYVTPCGATSRHVVQSHKIWRCTASRYATSHHAAQHHVTSHKVTRYDVAQRHDMLRHTMWRGRRKAAWNVSGKAPEMFSQSDPVNTCLLRHTYNALFFIHSPQLLYLYITFTTNHDLQRTWYLL